MSILGKPEAGLAIDVPPGFIRGEDVNHASVRGYPYAYITRRAGDLELMFPPAPLVDLVLASSRRRLDTARRIQ